MAFICVKVIMEDVQDTKSLLKAMEKEGFGTDDIVGIAAKTEGNGGVNDFGRVLVDRMLRDFFVSNGSRTREQAMEIPIALSGGCPGFITPHLNVFAKVKDTKPTDEPRLAVGKSARLSSSRGCKKNAGWVYGARRSTSLCGRPM